jgi:predicted dehydrogenase
MQMPLRIAFISATGTVAKRTLPALRRSAEFSVVALHGRDTSRVSQLAESYDVTSVYDDPARMLEACECDMVFIGSPPFLHEEHIRLALEHRVPVMCEKPLAHSLQSAENIARLIAKAEVPFMLAHHLRHQPAIVRVTEHLKSRSLGELRAAHLSWHFLLNPDAPNATWKHDPTRGGPNAFYDAGIHAIDLAILFFGPPVAVVSAGYAARSKRTIDTMVGLLIYDRFIAQIGASQAVAIAPNSLEIIGAQAFLSVPHALSETPADTLAITTPSSTKTECFPSQDPYLEEICSFASALAPGGKFTGTSIDDALLGMRILDALESSRLVQRVVHMN